MKRNKQAKEFKIRIEVAYQCEMEQSDYDNANNGVNYVFGDCPLKIKAAVDEARKYGHGILMIVNGNKVVRDILF